MKGTYSFLRSPTWIAGAVIAAAVAVIFVNLGLWQLRRLDERRALNATIESRFDAPPADLGELLDTWGHDPAALQYRRAVVTGRYAVGEEVLLQARTYRSRSGHNVVTPLVWDGGVIAVNRGWVPIDSEGPPVPTARPPDDAVTTTGVLLLSEDRGPLGRQNPDGSYDNIGRIDLGILAPQWGPGLVPVYLQLEEQNPAQGQYPIPLDPPEVVEGPHLGYAVQWFLFAAVIMIGFPSLVVTTAKRRSATTDSLSTPSSAA
jgi:cytochrome oxidase assembly protein ShyY1